MPTTNQEDTDTALQDLVVGNHILAHEGVVDAYGHVSIRHPENPERYILSCSRSPELVTRDDLIEYTLAGDAIDDSGLKHYAERFIHGAIYEARPDVHSVVHNHSLEVIPFTITDTKMRPVLHVASLIGADLPVWDIHDKFGDTNLLVVNMEQGRDLAACLGDRKVVLMRGHGCAVAGPNLKEAVMTSIYLQVNGQVQMRAMQMGNVHYLSPGEVKLCEETLGGALSVSRAWEYLSSRVQSSP